MAKTGSRCADVKGGKRNRKSCPTDFGRRIASVLSSAIRLGVNAYA